MTTGQGDICIKPAAQSFHSDYCRHRLIVLSPSEVPTNLGFGHTYKFAATLLFIFPNLYIINLPTIIAIQFLDGFGENIVKLYKPVYRIMLENSIAIILPQCTPVHHLKIVWKLVNSMYY